MNKQLGKKLRPDIFSYHDYRAFLKDWFDYLKRNVSGFSLRSLAREAKLASGYLPMVLSGKRKLSVRALHKIAPHLHLSQTERNFIELLLTLSDELSEELREEAFEKIQRYRGYREVHPQETEAYRYLSHWYYVAIREMALLPDFQMDAKKIQERLRGKVSLREIQQALDFLVANRLIEKGKKGKITATQKAVQCVGGIFRLALGAFHRQILHLAADALGEVKQDKRAVIGYTMPISKENYHKLVKILETTKDKIATLEDVSEADNEVYHIALAAFPLTNSDNE